MRMGLEIIEALNKLWPQDFQVAKTIELVGSPWTVEQLERGVDPRTIIAGWAPQLDRFRSIRAKYLIY